MKKIFYLAILLAFVSCSSHNKNGKTSPDVFLSALESTHPKSVRPLGRLTAELYNQDEQLLQQLSAPFGDCMNCVRGFTVKDYLGIRLEGDSLKVLRTDRKQSPAVVVEHCPLKAVTESQYLCPFSIDEHEFLFKLTLTE